MDIFRYILKLEIVDIMFIAFVIALIMAILEPKKISLCDIK